MADEIRTAEAEGAEYVEGSDGQIRADFEEREHLEKERIYLFDADSGEQRQFMTVDQVFETLESDEAKALEIVNGCISPGEVLAPGLVALTVDSPLGGAISLGTAQGENIIRETDEYNPCIWPGPIFIYTADADISADEIERATSTLNDEALERAIKNRGVLLVNDITALRGEAIEPVSITITVEENEEFGGDEGTGSAAVSLFKDAIANNESKAELWALKGAATGEYLGIDDVFLGLKLQAGIRLSLEKMGFSIERDGVSLSPDGEQEEIPLAQYSKSEAYTNHSLAMKALNGMIEIAHGEPSYTLTPRSGNSRESYKITASTENCRRFFVEDKGNAELMKLVLDTVQTLRKDKQAEGFTHAGRVWFSVNKIIEEMCRTEGGTLEGKKSTKRHVVNDALLAASGVQIVGTDPEGNPLNVEYFINAVRREKVTYKGNTYRDVWGFLISDETINEYADELGQGWNYPLLKADGALTIDQASIERYLKDKLHEARGHLYTAEGNRRRAKTYDIRLSWDEIFKTFRPIAEPDWRQKKKIVENFEYVLKRLADMDAVGELHKGRPMSITAHSTRQRGRGSGGGAWDKLIITCKSTYRKPNIHLL